MSLQFVFLLFLFFAVNVRVLFGIFVFIFYFLFLFIFCFCFCFPIIKPAFISCIAFVFELFCFIFSLHFLILFMVFTIVSSKSINLTRTVYVLLKPGCKLIAVLSRISSHFMSLLREKKRMRSKLQANIYNSTHTHTHTCVCVRVSDLFIAVRACIEQATPLG